VYENVTYKYINNKRRNIYNYYFNTIYSETYGHCRWKTVLCRDVLSNTVLQEENLHLFSDNTFEEILTSVKDICDKVKGIGKLSVYDITSAICRYNKINVTKVYIVGKGPQRAIKLLKLTTKTQKIDDTPLKYIEICDLLKAFQEINHELPLELQNSINGDDYESYICNWQKTV
jgi:hypothetical protein